MAVWENPTNFSGGQNVSSINGMFSYGDYVTNGFFAEGILVIIWVMVFFSTASQNSKKATTVATFITTIFSVFFMRLELVPIFVPVLLSIGFIIALIVSSQEGSSNI